MVRIYKVLRVSKKSKAYGGRGHKAWYEVARSPTLPARPAEDRRQQAGLPAARFQPQEAEGHVPRPRRSYDDDDDDDDDDEEDEDEDDDMEGGFDDEYAGADDSATHAMAHGDEEYGFEREGVREAGDGKAISNRTGNRLVAGEVGGSFWNSGSDLRLAVGLRGLVTVGKGLTRFFVCFISLIQKG